MKRSLLWPVALVILVGCAGSIFNTEPLVDARKDAQGNVILLDTPRMWRDWTRDVDRAVTTEVNGQRPGGGSASWEVQWRNVIEANKSRENAPRYIAYIIERRRKAGLPELED